MEIQVLPSVKLICQHVPGSHSKWGIITLRLWVILPSPVFPGAGCFKVKHVGWQGSNPSEAHCAICRATISSVVRLRVWCPGISTFCATWCSQCSLWWWRKDIWWYRATRILVAITAKWCMIPYFNGPEFWCVRTCLTSQVTLLIFASTVTISQGFGQAAKVDQFATYEKELNVVACHGFPNHQYDQDRWIAGIHLASLGFPTFESARFDVNENVISQPAVALALHSEWILNSPNVSQSLQPASCQWEDFHRACHSWLSLFIHPCWDFSMLLFPWHQCKS